MFGSKPSDRSPMKTIFSPVNRNSGADNFAVDSDIEATPKVIIKCGDKYL